MKFGIISASLASLLLAACAQTHPCDKAANPAECRNWTDAGGDANDYLLYGMAGYMIGSAMSGGSKHTYIYRDPSYGGTYHPSMMRKYGDRSFEIKRLEKKVQRQKVELRRKEAVIQRQKAEMQRSKSSIFSTTKSSSWRSKSNSWGSSSGSRRRSRK